MFTLLIGSGLFLGWALGSNDAANVFGTAVASRTIRHRHAIVIASIFIILGAVTGGTRCMSTLGALTNQTAQSAFAATLSAAVTVTVMSCLRLPVSTSQAVVGSIIGVGIVLNSLDLGGLKKVIICWVGTPVGAMVISYLLYKIFQIIIARMKVNLLMMNTVIKIGLIVGGAYGAYALGANNVANVTGMFVGVGLLTAPMAAFLGGISIAFGVLTYSRNVMFTVGADLVQLSGQTALVAVLSAALTVHLYAIVGVPVSTSQAIVGGVMGIGLAKGMRSVNNRTLIRILLGWLCTPLVAGILSFCFYSLIH